MVFVIYAKINNELKKTIEINKDIASIEAIIDSIKNNGYNIGDKKYKYDLTFTDVFSFGEIEQYRKKCLVVTI